MAILPDIPGLEVNVRVDGFPLTEYQDPREPHESSGNRTTRYIEATSGTTFDIYVQFNPEFQVPNNAVSLAVWIEGSYLVDEIFLEEALRDHLPCAAAINGINKSSNSLEANARRKTAVKSWKFFPFEFVGLEITNDIDGKRTSSATTMPELGEIKVEFHHKQYLGITGTRRDYTPLNEVGPVSEKSVKGEWLTHSARLGEGTPSSEPPPEWKMAYLGDPAKPFASFVFRYRSLEALKAACIIPRTPPPVSLEPCPMYELSAGELQEFREKERNARAKQEYGGKQEHGIKREGGFKQESDIETKGIVAGEPELTGHTSDVEVLNETPSIFQKAIPTVDLTKEGDEDNDDEV